MELAFLMQWCKNSGQTGTLVLSRDEKRKDLHFEKGWIVSSGSNDPREYLGQFLVAMGKISEEQLNFAFEIQRKTDVLLGRILVARKFISEKELREAMDRKVMEMLFTLFLWKDGEFTFNDRTLGAGKKRVDLRVDPENCILECARRVDEWKRYRAVFPHDRLAVARTERKAPAYDREPMKKRLLALAREEVSIERMCLELRTGAFTILGGLYELRRRGLITVFEAEGKKPAARKKGARKFKSVEDEAAWLYKKALPPDKVPALAMSISALKEVSLTSQEAFIVTRINGRWDVRSIVMICPIGEVETLRALKRFIDEGIITLT